MFFVRPEVQQRKEPNNTRKRGRPGSYNPIPFSFGNNSNNNSNSPLKVPRSSGRGNIFRGLSFENLEKNTNNNSMTPKGGKRKHRKTTQKKRKTQRKK
jgi:hypothetical protein